MAHRDVLSTTLEHRGDALVVTLAGRLDSSVAENLHQMLRDAIVPTVRRLVIDFNGLDYINSAGLRVVLMVGKQIRGAEGRVIFVGLHGIVEEVFGTCGFLIIFDTAPSLEAALGTP